jgi:NRPS condensation-like uncharacterized protein
MTAITMRLDNASNIYPASLTKKYASLFRQSVTLSEPVNVNYLQQALNNTVKRIPSFGCTLKNGAFWWYLKELNKLPIVGEYTSLSPFGYKFHGGFLFKVSVDDCRIVLDVFHALADGKGGQTFLLTLTAEYLRLRYGIKIDYNELILDPTDTPSKRESEDCFTEFSGKKGEMDQNGSAYHACGHKVGYRTLHNERGIVPFDELKTVTSKYSCTVTELITAAMVSAIQEVHKHDHRKTKKSTIKVSVPVNLRPIFGGRTLRNFSSYVNLGVDVSNGYFSFEEILENVSAQKRHLVLRSELERKVAANVALENNFAIAMIPLFIKRYAIDTVCKIKGDKLFSQTFSNLGNVVLPDSMKQYVREMDFMLGRQRGTPGAAAAVGYNGNLYLNFSRNIVEADFESYFVDRLHQLGITTKQVSE